MNYKFVTSILFTFLIGVFPWHAHAQRALVQGRQVIGTLPRPSHNSQAEGTVVVQIKVDQYGAVVEAVPGVEGTTVTDKVLWNAARSAALKAHFNQSSSAPAMQTGTLTYTFSLSSGNVEGVNHEGLITPLKELVNAKEYGNYTIKAKYVKVQDEYKLIFLVEEDDYIIPIQLVKKDLGAVNRFHSLDLHPGDSLTISGRLSKINISFEDYSGLVEAAIIDIIHNNNVPGTESDILPETKAYALMEVKPSFNGGDANEFSKWVNDNLRYPAAAKNNGVQGRVIVKFTIMADGSVTDVSVVRGVEESLDLEAVRVVSKSPKWKPGIVDGQPVKVTYTFPVIFHLQ